MGADNNFEQNRTFAEYVQVLERWGNCFYERWGNRLIKAARSGGVDYYSIPQGRQSEDESEAYGRFLDKIEELNDKIDKVEKQCDHSEAR